MATSDSPLTVAPSRDLNLAQGSALVSGGDDALRWETKSLDDGEILTLTTNGAEGWDFGPAPTDVATLGFGQGYLYKNSVGTGFAQHSDDFSGQEWLYERADLSTDRVIAETPGGYRSLQSVAVDTHISGGFIGWGSAAALPENETILISRVTKADWSFINTNNQFEYAVDSVDSASQITLTAPWAEPSSTKLRVNIAADSATSDSLRGSKIYVVVNNGSAVATLEGSSEGDFSTLGVSPGDSLRDYASVQWKAFRSGSQPVDFDSDFIYQKNNNGFFGWPAVGAWSSTHLGTLYGGSGQPVHRQWSRVDQHIDLGTLGNPDGTISDRAICPDQGDGFNEGVVSAGSMLHWSDPATNNGPHRWQWFNFQEYLQYALGGKVDVADILVQTGTLSRFEIADGATPSVTAAAFILPPVKNQWSNAKVEVKLWKALFSDFQGLYLHFYDVGGVFRKAVAL